MSNPFSESFETRALRALIGAFLLLFLTYVSNGANSSGQIGSVAISPDGKLVVVDFQKGSTSFIYKIAVDTGVATRLTDAKEGKESSPSFSPDGKRIAFTYWPDDHRRSRIIIVTVDGSDLRQGASNGRLSFNYDVYRLNPDTGEVEKLTNGNGYATGLRVSADGKTAAFLKWRKNWLGELIANQIFLLDLQSRKLSPVKISGLG